MGSILDLAQAQQLPKGMLKDWAYNSLDNTGTREIADVLLGELNARQQRTYAFERALQAPAISMMMRGVRVDVPRRDAMIRELKQELKKDDKSLASLPDLVERWDGTELVTGLCPANPGKHHRWPRGVADSPDKHCKLCGASRVVPKAFNANSPDQSHHLFYNLYGFEPLTNKKGEVSTDDDTLTRLGKKHPEVKPITDAILAIRDKKKQLGSLAAKLSSDGRYHSTFNVGAAWTGRFSSSKDPFGRGGNLQNWAPRHRRALLADPGFDLGYADYMQGESNIVAHLSGDAKYLEAHLGGDVHTYVTRYVWPELPWTGDLKKDKKIAKQLPPWDQVEGHDYRFQCKRIQHGSNYGLTPYGISMIAQIPLKQAEKAQLNYFDEFEGIPAWQMDIKKKVENHEVLVNPLGREWQPFGRSWDKHTWRQALSFLPQSLLADIDDIAAWLIWYELEEQEVYLLAQVHDALLHEYPEGRLDLEREALKRMCIPVPVTDIRGHTRVMVIGVESAVGKNWGHKRDDNPKGIDEEPIERYLKEHPL